MKLNKKSGFTLLEIIIVVIIVGVLASLALPKLFSTVEFSKSSEALATISSIRSSMDRCHLSKAQNYENCNTFAELDLDDPQNNAGAHFSYQIATTGDDTTDYVITATRFTTDGGDGSSAVFLEQDSQNVTKWGSGSFSGL